MKKRLEDLKASTSGTSSNPKTDEALKEKINAELEEMILQELSK